MIANLLILNGANVNQYIGSNKNTTSLHLAASNMDTVAIALLVVYGAD